MIVIVNIILIIGLFSMLRIIVGILISFAHQLQEQHDGDQRGYTPLISVIIPAYNEQESIKDCVMSVIHQSYRNRQIIVVNDGSTDKTAKILKEIKQELRKKGELDTAFSSDLKVSERFVVASQYNQGKSYAINNGVKNYAKGELVTVLDADSQLAPNALERTVTHFTNPRVIATAINVRIKSVTNLIDFVQRVEYILGYRLKGSEPTLRLEYIIGGVGSTFRKWVLAKVNYYDTDTVTEDIDLTMKLLEKFGNRKWRIDYVNDVVAYTPAVHKFSQLIKQRYRWKLGRFQALFKHRHLLFNRHLRTYSLTLSWWKLPKVFIEEFFIFIEPLLVLWMLYITFYFKDLSMFITVLAVYFIFALVTFSFEKLKFTEKVELIVLSPAAYLFLYTITVVDFICLLKCLAHFSTIFNQKSKASWEHVDR